MKKLFSILIILLCWFAGNSQTIKTKYVLPYDSVLLIKPNNTGYSKSAKGIFLDTLFLTPNKLKLLTGTNGYVLTSDANGNLSLQPGGGGGGGSPAGNYGNLQINRNSVFSTPASDSLSFNSALLKTLGGARFGNFSGTSTGTVRVSAIGTNPILQAGMPNTSFATDVPVNFEPVDSNVTTIVGLNSIGVRSRRRTLIGANGLRFRFKFGIDQGWELGLKDSINNDPQNLDGIAAVRNEFALGKADGFSGKSILQTGTGSDAVSVTLSQVGIYGSTSNNRFYIKPGISSVTSYLIDPSGSIEDTIAVYYGHLSGGAGDLLPKVLKGYDFFGGILNTAPRVDSMFTFFDNGINSRNYFGSPTAFGGGHTGPVEALEVYGSPKFVDGNQANGYVWTSDVNGKGHWGAVGALLNFSVATAANTANYTVSGNNYIILSDLTGQASRTVTLPSSPAAGQVLILDNVNTGGSGFTWTAASGTLKDWGNNTVTTLINQTVYFLIYQGSNWKIQ